MDIGEYKGERTYQESKWLALECLRYQPPKAPNPDQSHKIDGDIPDPTSPRANFQLPGIECRGCATDSKRSLLKYEHPSCKHLSSTYI